MRMMGTLFAQTRGTGRPKLQDRQLHTTLDREGVDGGGDLRPGGVDVKVALVKYCFVAL